VSLVGTVVIAAWLNVLVIAFNLILNDRLTAQAQSAGHERAQTVAATVGRHPDGTVKITEADNDALLDIGVWVYVGRGAIERPSDPADVQATADHVAASPGTHATVGALLLYSTPVWQRNQTIATVVASVNMTAYKRAAKLINFGSALFALLVLVAAYLVLRLTAARALRPVESMAAQAAEWASHARPDRFGRHSSFKELNTLAQNLDALLDRLAAVLRHERQLLAELSHELRTPLSRILTESELLLESGGHEREGASIRESAESMSTILETLLSTARLEQGTLPGTCDVGALLASIDVPLSQVKVADDAREVGVDRNVAERILAPILDNARRFARRRVSITVTRPAEMVAIDIHTDGPEIPAEMRERVFEPGFRIPREGDAHDGVGLGLPLARRLARAADGDVNVEPTLEGATVRITLPSA
jgi:signal transduction histidine kinase